MRLKLDDFVHVRANWSPKSANLLDLANDLDLALDSFIFIDDSPLECAEVRMQCPDVAVLHLPSDAPSALQSLRHFWPLDIDAVTDEATQRTAFYHQEQRRRELRQHWTQSLPDFINSLELEVTIRPAETTDHARMVDLMRRTTQFNLTGERYSAAEIEALHDSTRRHVVDVQDRFGSYGTVGLMMFSTDDESLTLTTLLLSCRALGRGVEHRMLAHLGRVAVTQGLDKVQLRYVATARNLPARQFLDEVAVPQHDTADASALYVIGAKDAATLRYNPDFTPAAGPVPVPAVADRETAWRSGGDARPKSWAQLGGAAVELTTAESIRMAIGGAVSDGVGNLDDRTDDERAVSRIWAEILQVPPGHVNDDFRSLGGGSLEIVQLLARVYEEFKIEIPVDLLLDNSFTASNVVAMIRLLRASGAGSAEGAIPWVE
jgi:FkbH-like protein